MGHRSISFSAAELLALGPDHIPQELQTGGHLVYSSPATLAYNSPGAEGFGVKRAGLAIPGSVMLLVAPGCCGRNTSLVSEMPAYRDRFFYLNMDETDIVTGRHLRKIPQAVGEIVSFLTDLGKPPELVMICITCVDALLGTDMERVCRQAEETVQIPVRPCYMYALTREGRRPPMVHVRQSLYELLEPVEKKAASMNLLGFFAPVTEEWELLRYLRRAGMKQIREISRCENYRQFLQMGEANFNLVLHPEARAAAGDLQERLGIPSIELTRVYQTDKIHNQYQALGKVLGISVDDQEDRHSAEAAVHNFMSQFGAVTISLGECLNADAFELALAMTRYGIHVAEIFGTLQQENYPWLRQLAQQSPDTRVYSNMEPTMLYYDPSDHKVNLTLGKDAGYYHPECPNVPWNEDRQPYGYAGIRQLFAAMGRALSGGD